MEKLLRDIEGHTDRLVDKCARLGMLSAGEIGRLEAVARRAARPTEHDILLLGRVRDAKYARDVLRCPRCGHGRAEREGVPMDKYPSFVCGRCARVFHQCPVHGDNVSGASMYSMQDGTFAVEPGRVTCTCGTGQNSLPGVGPHLRMVGGGGPNRGVSIGDDQSAGGRRGGRGGGGGVMPGVESPFMPAPPRS